MAVFGNLGSCSQCLLLGLSPSQFQRSKGQSEVRNGLYPKINSGNFQVQVRLKGLNPITRTFSSKALAKEYAREIEGNSALARKMTVSRAWAIEAGVTESSCRMLDWGGWNTWSRAEKQAFDVAGEYRVDGNASRNRFRPRFFRRVFRHKRLWVYVRIARLSAAVSPASAGHALCVPGACAATGWQSSSSRLA